MIQHYPLEWMDSLISITLNPAKMYLKDLTREAIQNLSEKALIESVHVQSALKNQVFALHKESQIRLLVQKYHCALIILLDTLGDYQKQEGYTAEYGNIAANLTSCLDELLFFIETRFANYLSLEERIPPTYLAVSRTELKLKLDRIQKKLIADVADPAFTSIVLEDLYRFIHSRKTESITLREVLYRKELVQKLELLGAGENHTTLYNALNELLVYMNFNSRGYINYFTRTIAQKINTLATKAEQIDSLHFHYKEFSQMQSHKTMLLYPQHPALKTILDNWFRQEIRYLEKTLHFPDKAVRAIRRSDSPSLKANNKIRVNLSADQIALLLRACDEARLVEARSMSEVFRKIVPHMSTPAKVDLSYESVRSKSYTAEERDKTAAIAVLEKLIQKIKRY